MTDDAYLEDILAAATQVTVYIGEMDRAAFLEDRRTQDAVVRQIEIMGEASTHVSNDLKDAHLEIDRSDSELDFLAEYEAYVEWDLCDHIGADDAILRVSMTGDWCMG